jgi:protein-L-isoaspartate(D-aspartate) O-methyltransferase
MCMDKTVDEFFRKLDRKLFLDEKNKPYSDFDGPISIGYGQTISQPSLVLEMTKLLMPDKNCRVLEIGTGSGYQSAFLAEFSGSVYTVERIDELSKKAKRVLKNLGYNNIYYKTGDGSDGWKEHAPYDRIIVTAAAGEFPAELFNQLSPEGFMLIPIGSRYHQDLQIIKKNKNNEPEIKNILPVRFVEFVGKYGHDEQF